MNLVKKLLLFSSFGIYIFIVPNSFALDKANLTVDNNKIDINDYIKLNISIETSTWWSIWINDIAWIEWNFDIVWQSQSQSSSSQVSILNWKTETKTVTQYSIVLELKAKNKWIYEIWPANVVWWSEKIKTNSVKVEVTWDKLFVNWNHLKINKNNNNSQNSFINNQKYDEIIDFWKNMKKRNFDDDESLYILIIVLLIIWAWLYLIIKKDKKNNLLTKNKENLESNSDNIQEKEIEFEENKENLVYPELEDVGFINKLESIFKIKLFNKYKIFDIWKYDYNELLEKIPLSRPFLQGEKGVEEKINLEKIIKTLNKAKYSNSFNYDEKNNLINLIKNI